MDRPLHKLLVLGFVSFAATLPPEPARASCGREPDATVVPPPFGVRAPRNVKPRITLHANWRTWSYCPPWIEGSCFAGHFELRLRAAGSDAPIAVDLRESSSGDIATVAIVPRAPLPANRRFEIVQTEGGSKEAPRVVGTFVTGDRLDERAPTWAGVTGSTNVGHWPGREPPPASRRAITLDDLTCGGAGITFVGTTAAADEETREEDLRYALWTSEPSAPIDYTSPPLAYERGEREWLRNGGSRLVIRFGGTIAPSTFSFPNDKRTLKFGLRAIDLAGNLGEPSELVVRAP